MLVSTNMSDEEVAKFERLPVEEQERQIGFAMLAKLNPLSEWLTDEEIFELHRKLAPAT